MPRLWNFRPRSAIMQTNEGRKTHGICIERTYPQSAQGARLDAGTAGRGAWRDGGRGLISGNRGCPCRNCRCWFSWRIFFDTSVDALIGYTIKDNRRDATLARLMDLRHAKDLRGVDEAERGGDALSELLCHRLSGGGDDAGFRVGAERQSLDGAGWKLLGRGLNALTLTRVTT